MLVHSSSMAVWSCWILAGTGTRCRIRRSRASQTCSMGDLSGEYAGHARTVMFSASRNCVQILATYICTLCIIMLQHDVVDECTTRASGSRHGISVHANAINKMHLCSFSITYACPYHNPHRHYGPLDPQCWHQQTAHPHDVIHAVCHLPCTVKPGFIREENTSPKCQTPSNVRHLPLKLVTMMNCSQFETRWGRRACRWASLRRFLTGCAEILWLCKPIVAAAVRVADLRRSWRWRCGGPGLVWLHVVCGCEAGWMYCQILWNALETAYGREMNIQLMGKSSGGHSAVNMPIACSLKTYDICGIVLCDKTAHFRVAFYCGQPKTQLFNNHAV